MLGRMQSARLPTAVETILKSKLADVEKKHAELMEAVHNINDHVMATEKQVVSFVTAETYTAKDALLLAMEVDGLMETLTTCHQAVSDVLHKTQMLNLSATQKVQSCDSNNSTARPNIVTDSNTAAVDVMTVQMEVLQQQVSSLQELQDTKNQEQEIMLDRRCTSADTDFHLRLQNVEAKLLLLHDVQTRDYTTIHNAVDELSTLRIDIMSLQDDITSTKKYQKALEGKTEEVKNKTDDLVRLRQILNDLHTNVTQREELTQKLNELQENVNTINSVLNPFMAEIDESNPNEIVIGDNSDTED